MATKKTKMKKLNETNKTNKTKKTKTMKKMKKMRKMRKIMIVQSRFYKTSSHLTFLLDSILLITKSKRSTSKKSTNWTRVHKDSSISLKSKTGLYFEGDTSQTCNTML